MIINRLKYFFIEKKLPLIVVHFVWKEAPDPLERVVVARPGPSG
jgi:hypothetical protein